MDSAIQVVTTTDKREDAERIARTLVEKRLAACVQLVGPVISTYWWKGRIETAEEWQCWAKTEEGFYEDIEKTIKSVHPYELPEIIAVSVKQVLPAYRQWVLRETTA